MTYKEKLARYRNQTATPQEIAEIENDLEKYQAITDYLLEEEDAMELPPLVEDKTEHKKSYKQCAAAVDKLCFWQWCVLVW